MAQTWKRDYTRYKNFFLNVLSIYNSKPNLRVYLELVLTLGTIIMFVIFAIKPTILTIIDINNEIKNKEAIISSLEKKITDLQTASSILQKEESNLILIDQGVPSSPELETLITQIESLANTNSLKISGISSSDLLLKGVFEKVKKTNDLEPLPDDSNELSISIAVTGSYSDLVNFIKSVENLRRPLKFDTFMFNSSRSNLEEKILTLTITGRFPYLVKINGMEENEKQ